MAVNPSNVVFKPLAKPAFSEKPVVESHISEPLFSLSELFTDIFFFGGISLSEAYISEYAKELFDKRVDTNARKDLRFLPNAFFNSACGSIIGNWIANRYDRHGPGYSALFSRYITDNESYYIRGYLKYRLLYDTDSLLTTSRLTFSEYLNLLVNRQALIPIDKVYRYTEIIDIMISIGQELESQIGTEWQDFISLDWSLFVKKPKDWQVKLNKVLQKITTIAVTLGFIEILSPGTLENLGGVVVDEAKNTVLNPKFYAELGHDLVYDNVKNEMSILRKELTDYFTKMTDNTKIDFSAITEAWQTSSAKIVSGIADKLADAVGSAITHMTDKMAEAYTLLTQALSNESEKKKDDSKHVGQGMAEALYNMIFEKVKK